MKTNGSGFSGEFLRLIWCVSVLCGSMTIIAAQETSPEAKSAVSTTRPEATPSTDEENPKPLDERTSVKIEPAAPGVTPITATNQPKSFTWDVSWRGWDGLHFELVYKTLLGYWVPSVTNASLLSLNTFAERLEGSTNASPQTNVLALHLEQVSFTMKIGGNFAIDAAAFVTDNQFQGFDNGAELRRAQLYAKGDFTLLLPAAYKIEVGYIPRQFYIDESYLAFRNIPWIGELKMGEYQAPMGLDVVTSSRDITFMEPAAPMQALAPGNNAGFQIGKPVFDYRATWRFGLFTEGVSRDFGDASKDYARIISRITALPIDDPNPGEPGAPRLLHLGLSANLLYSGSSTVRYNSRPESHLAPVVVDTGDIDAQGSLVCGAEAAWVQGPFSVQGEYLHSFVEQTGGDTLNFDGCYGSVSWFLTGESRPYNRSEGDFARLIPNHNFDWGHGGWGAWEIAARGSYVDLNSDGINGGRLAMAMGGLNWYPHSHVKWRFNYGFGHVADHVPAGNINVFESRIEVDF